jgi:hypothetical protein
MLRLECRCEDSLYTTTKVFAKGGAILHSHNSESSPCYTSLPICSPTFSVQSFYSLLLPFPISHVIIGAERDLW